MSNEQFSDKFRRAEELLEDFDNNEKAFVLFSEIVSETNLPKLERAEALNMQGVIVSGYNNSLSKNKDETGLEYFKQAINLDANCLSAHFNIISHFGNSIGLHNDKRAFDNSLNYLRMNESILSSEMKTRIKEIELKWKE